MADSTPPTIPEPRDTGRVGAPSKQAYRRPTLTEYGTLEQLTRASGVGSLDLNTGEVGTLPS